MRKEMEEEKERRWRKDEMRKEMKEEKEREVTPGLKD